MRTPKRLIPLVCWALIGLGCDNEAPIEVYDAPKDPPPMAVVPAGQGPGGQQAGDVSPQMGPTAATPDAMSAEQIKWTLPDGWSVQSQPRPHAFGNTSIRRGRGN